MRRRRGRGRSPLQEYIRGDQRAAPTRAHFYSYAGDSGTGVLLSLLRKRESSVQVTGHKDNDQDGAGVLCLVPLKSNPMTYLES